MLKVCFGVTNLLDLITDQALSNSSSFTKILLFPFISTAPIDVLAPGVLAPGVLLLVLKHWNSDAEKQSVKEYQILYIFVSQRLNLG